MEEVIDRIHEVSGARSIGQAKVKNAKKIIVAAKMCVYFKDTECRIPVCDMKVCEKCPEGHVYCTRVAFIRTMVQKILLFVFCFIMAEII
jgi:hypothetical protein